MSYDILVGPQAFYRLDFGLDNKSEEASIQPCWFAGERKTKLIPMAFVAAAITMSTKSMFDCSALIADLPCGPVLLEETLAFMANSVNQHDFLPLEVLVRLYKDRS